jgi:acetoin utilization protein AcuB
MAALKLVRDIMTKELSTLESDARLLDATLLMRSSGLRHLPIVKDGCPVGVISDRDVQRASPSMFSKISPEEYNKMFETTSIDKVMAKEPFTAAPDTPVKEVLQAMLDRKLGSCLVVDQDGKLMGIVTNTDLLRTLNQILGES